MKKILIAIFCIAIISTGIICFFNYKEKNEFSNTSDDMIILEEGWTENEVYKLESITDYYTVRNCIIKYYSYYYSLYDENSELSKTEVLNNLYSLLDKKYIEKNNITLDNIEKKFNTKINDVDVNLEKILYITNNDNMFIFFVSGNTRDLITNEFNDFSMIISLDVENETFSIFLEDYFDEFNNIEEGEVIKFNFSDEIGLNNVNKFKFYEYSFNEYVGDMFEEIRNYILYNPEKAYDILNKDNEFGNYNEFKKFINDNYKELFTMTFDSYILQYKDDSVLYNCKDKYNNFNVLIYANYPCDITFNIIKK